ncbi:MAG: heavy metal-associated domain-containing protein [Bacteroidota bacterium]
MKYIKINIKVFLLIVLAACSAATVEEDYKIVSFDTSLDCNNCKVKMFDNLPKEEGVVDLKVSVEEKTVTILFNEKETTVEKLADKIFSLGYSAYVISIDDYSGKF